MSDAESQPEASEDAEDADIVSSGPSPAGRGSTHENLPEDHKPNVPHAHDTETTDWEQYTAYRCLHCHDNCINKRDSVYARARECRHCFAVPTLDRHSADDPALDR